MELPIPAPAFVDQQMMRAHAEREVASRGLEGVVVGESRGSGLMHAFREHVAKSLTLYLPMFLATIGAGALASADDHMVPVKPQAGVHGAAVAGQKVADALPAPRRGGGRVDGRMPSAEYVIPLVSPETVVTVANLGDEEVRTFYYTGTEDVQNERFSKVYVPPGATRTVTGLGAGTTFVHTIGDSPIHLSARTMTGETSMVVTPVPLLNSGEHVWLPASDAIGLTVGSTNSPGGARFVVRNDAGNPVFDETVTLAKNSTFSVADIYTHANITPLHNGQVEVIPLTANMFVYGTRTDAGSGDRDVLPAQSRERASLEFILPVVRRQTTTVPFAQYTSMNTIHPNQEPFEAEFTLNLHEQDVPGSPLLLIGTQLYALSHTQWDNAVLQFFNWPASQGDIAGSSLGSEANPLLIWTDAYTMMPNGKVGTVIRAMGDETKCTPETTCSVLLDAESALGFYNRSGSPTTVTATGFDSEGVETGTLTRTLGTYENTSLEDLSELNGAVRAELTTTFTGSGENKDTYHAWSTTTTAGGDLDFRAAEVVEEEGLSPVQQYIADNFPGENDRFYLAGHEVYALVNGADGVPSMVSDLATEFWNDSNVQANFPDVGAVAQWLLDRADGDTSNSEFCDQFDPLLWTRDVGVRTYGGATCGPVDFKPGQESMLRIRTLVRDVFLPAYIENHTELYGDLTGDPTWWTQDPTNP